MTAETIPLYFPFPGHTEEFMYFSSPSQAGWGQVMRSDQWTGSRDAWHFGSEAVRAGLSSRHSLLLAVPRVEPPSARVPNW